jgi:hypothetical protein
MQDGGHGDEADYESRAAHDSPSIETGERLVELPGSDWADLDLDAGLRTVERRWTKYGELTQPKTETGISRIPSPLSSVST